MHELSIALSIVDGVVDELGQCGASEVSSVHLRLGRLAGVDKQALLFSYHVAVQETLLAHSRLIIEDVDVTIRCSTCGAEGRPQSFPVLTCNRCGALADRIIAGQELEITAMEVVS
jgi:hydrogenase nickel incorporation protein HypA/HybF